MQIIRIMEVFLLFLLIVEQLDVHERTCIPADLIRQLVPGLPTRTAQCRGDYCWSLLHPAFNNGIVDVWNFQIIQLLNFTHGNY